MAKRKVNRNKLVVIGGSAGSLEVLFNLLPKLNAGLAYPIVIVLHRKSSADTVLTDVLATKTELPVREIEEKEELKCGTIYVCPGNYHLLFEQDKTFSLDDSEKINYSRPSIDVAFQSAASVFGDKLACVLLSGANADGTDGFKYVLTHGGTTIAQLPETAEVPFMPQQAILSKAASLVMDVDAIADFMNGF